VGEYQKAGVTSDRDKMSFSLDEDFWFDNKFQR
jgi:hypothetical protein